jgi:hypothetical protein
VAVGVRPQQLRRSQALNRLRRWTTAVVMTAAGLGGLFSILAAATAPGRSDSGAAGAATPAAATQADPNAQAAQPNEPVDSQGDAGQGFFAPAQQGGFVGPGGGAPWAVSGGSR